MHMPDDIRRFVESSFPMDTWVEALSILGKACAHGEAAPSPRLLRCAVFASRGSTRRLEHLVSQLAVDWRDVVVAGEYALRDGALARVRDPGQPFVT